MEKSKDACQEPSADWLPPDVLWALDQSAVGAIKALQRSRGFGLFQAKLVIDAYLERHPGLKTPASGRIPADPQDALGAIPDVASPVPSYPILYEELPHRIRLPQTYVIASSTVSDGGQWFAEVLRTCLRLVQESASVEVIDEERANAKGDIAGIVLKISEPLSNEAFGQLSEALRAHTLNWTDVRLVKGVQPADIPLRPGDLKVEYFRHEFSVDSRMIYHTSSCAKLTHVPTEISCRSTVHRSRIMNYEEALFLLASLVVRRSPSTFSFTKIP